MQVTTYFNFVTLFFCLNIVVYISKIKLKEYQCLQILLKYIIIVFLSIYHAWSLTLCDIVGETVIKHRYQRSKYWLFGKLICLGQGWATYGPRAVCGPQSILVWPARPLEEKIKIWMNIMCTFARVAGAARDRNLNSFSASSSKKVAHHWPRPTYNCKL